MCAGRGGGSNNTVCLEHCTSRLCCLKGASILVDLLSTAAFPTSSVREGQFESTWNLRYLSFRWSVSENPDVLKEARDISLFVKARAQRRATTTSLLSSIAQTLHSQRTNDTRVQCENAPFTSGASGNSSLYRSDPKHLSVQEVRRPRSG